MIKALSSHILNNKVPLSSADTRKRTTMINGLQTTATTFTLPPVSILTKANSMVSEYQTTQPSSKEQQEQNIQYIQAGSTFTPEQWLRYTSPVTLVDGRTGNLLTAW